MRIDVVSIFPDYLAPLQLSLVGKAQAAGLLDVSVHDLRDWTHDRHRTVDDTPYGGGAGMVMRPEPWGEALDALADERAVLVVPTPSGERLTQRLAAELSAEEHLVFACGRYEGIDQRVVEHAGSRMRVREVSIGDYVVNGGEVAALVVIEAVVRLLPGFMGNPESLAEESHGLEGLLEYPVYTKPPAWRGHDVPEVLLSGDHARIDAWRRQQALRRTAERRPDLVPRTATTTANDLTPVPAGPADAGELWTLQRACWVQGALASDTLHIPLLNEDLDDVRVWMDTWSTYVVRAPHPDGRLVGAVRARLVGETWQIGRLMVAPDLQGRGIGQLLLERAEAAAPAVATRFALFTGTRSTANLRRYKSAGYRPIPDQGDEPGVVWLGKPVRRAPSPDRS